MPAYLPVRQPCARGGKGPHGRKAPLVQWVVATVLADAPSSSTIAPAAAVFRTGLIGLDTCTAGQERSLRASQASENICQCNHNPLCRHHHRCKQAEGWWLEQPEPGVLVWRTPAGRTYTTTPTRYAA
jgi:hypothetical protein